MTCKLPNNESTTEEAIFLACEYDVCMDQAICSIVRFIKGPKDYPKCKKCNIYVVLYRLCLKLSLESFQKKEELKKSIRFMYL